MIQLARCSGLRVSLGAALLLATLLPAASLRDAATSAAQGCDPANPAGCPIAANQPQLAALSVPGSSHLWVFELTEPVDFIVDLLDPDIDLRLYGYAPDNTLLEVSDRPGRDSEQLAVTTQLTGRYQIFVDSPRSEASPTPYTIVITVVDPRALLADNYEPDGTALLASPLVPGQAPQVRSLHEGSDEDWVYLDLVAGARVVIFTLGTGCDPLLALYAPDGSTLLAYDDDSGIGLNAQLDYLVPETNTYYVRVLASLGESCASYELAAEYRAPIRPDAYEPDDTRQQAKPLAFDGAPQPRSFHTLEDVDWVSFTLQPGQTVRLFTTGPCDLYLDLYAPDGVTRLASDDDTGEGLNPQLDFVATQAGTHYAMIYPYTRSVCESYQLVGIPLTGAATPPTAPVVPVGPAPAGATTIIVVSTPAPGQVVDPFR